tara:strand:- start:252 stop:563 length:312 start_codon:yes stop_codon:yes gene_type:complete
MNLIIAASLCEPPSEATSFRDVTLYGKTFVFEDILLECEVGTRSFYWKWLKSRGAHDFISYLLKSSERESGFKLASRGGNLNVPSITPFNLDFILEVIYNIKK